MPVYASTVSHYKRSALKCWKTSARDASYKARDASSKERIIQGTYRQSEALSKGCLHLAWNIRYFSFRDTTVGDDIKLHLYNLSEVFSPDFLMISIGFSWVVFLNRPGPFWVFLNLQAFSVALNHLLIKFVIKLKVDPLHIKYIFCAWSFFHNHLYDIEISL